MASYLFTRNEITKLAKKILAMKPDIIAMEGPLGAGKTTLTKAIAKELGIEDVIVSPTFILHREYPGLDHIDAWRVEDFSEIERLGLGKMLAEKHLVIIEWADKFRQEIKRLRDEDIKIIWVRLEYAVNENERRITYENIGY
ncbi:MAG: tRNA (adenosine(37)-N6)-threonylcarbamoyltransferase complex ATPase subunit type 1 TsaE [Patescibacteria group bacterium]